ncbi:hypothetical protein DKT69_11330 [Micromonospora sicca]|uniref:Uncharacterized protein n=1 Tax=Micromonospora sicca TaxID=2202420 RepID=A0A317DL15_9ACTN|nr:hypothetical protein DKT69_11330 [Micromonospora sp. 4G51]
MSAAASFGKCRRARTALRMRAFTETWGRKYPAIVKLWENAWAEFVRRRCIVGSADVSNRYRIRGQIAWASSVNAAATRVAGGASIPSS